MNPIPALTNGAHPPLLNPPLEFYPAPSAIKAQRVLSAAAAAAAALLLWVFIYPTAFASLLDWIWPPVLLVLAATGAAGSLACLRAARLMARARENREPVLVLDDFGVTLRDDFLWRRWRFAWSRIREIGAVPDDKGVSIIFSGDLRPYGSLADIATDTRDDAGTINARLARFEGRMRK